MRRRTGIAAAALCCILALAGQLAAADVAPEEVIRRFAAKETEFKEARQAYTYSTNIKAQVLNHGGRPVEEMRLSIETYFTTDGKRHERTLNRSGELRAVQFTDQDLQDALHIQPFVLTTAQIPNYHIEYRGKEQVDELMTYAFDVRPKKMQKNQRYFEGKIWVDDQDFQIVKTYGKAVPDFGNNRFPRFETIRQPVDGYWFPVWTMADDTLEFGDWMSGKNRVRIRELITYDDYKKFQVGTSIKFGSPVDPKP